MGLRLTPYPLAMSGLMKDLEIYWNRQRTSNSKKNILKQGCSRGSVSIGWFNGCHTQPSDRAVGYYYMVVGLTRKKNKSGILIRSSSIALCVCVWHWHWAGAGSETRAMPVRAPDLALTRVECRTWSSLRESASRESEWAIDRHKNKS